MIARVLIVVALLPVCACDAGMKRKNPQTHCFMGVLYLRLASGDFVELLQGDGQHMRCDDE